MGLEVFLHECCWRGRGVQSVQPAKRLEHIFARVQELYNEHDVPYTKRLSNMRLSMFTDPDKPHKHYAFLKTKGGEMKHLIPVIAAIAQEVSSGSVHDTHVKDMFASIGAQPVLSKITFCLYAPFHIKICLYHLR